MRIETEEAKKKRLAEEEAEKAKKEAEKAKKEAEEKAKKEAELEKQVGAAAYKARDFPKAAEAFQKAWDTYPKDITFLTNLSGE